ncbi:hypothetical protein bcgnr5384_48170 [Bacillus cereus]
MKIEEESQTVVFLVKTVNYQPMEFPENNFGVGKYYNFIVFRQKTPSSKM